MTIADELARLEELRRNGSLTEIEFEEAKRKALQESSSPYTAQDTSAQAFDTQQGKVAGIQEDTYCMLMHLSQLLSFSGAGIVVPIVMWLVGKDESELVRQHGARMMNWLLSSLIYVIVAGILCIVVIGFPMLIVLAILEIVFPIMAAIKCNNGVLWSYPGTIKFLDEN